jgi:hypothetical protein
MSAFSLDDIHAALEKMRRESVESAPPAIYLSPRGWEWLKRRYPGRPVDEAFGMDMAHRFGIPVVIEDDA